MLRAIVLKRPRMLATSAAFLCTLVVLCVLNLSPLGMILYGSIHDSPSNTSSVASLDGFRALLSAFYLRVALTTVGIAAGKTIIALLIALLLAWIVARTDTPGRKTFEILLTLPFFFPPVLTAAAWSMLGNPRIGTINIAWQNLTNSKIPLINVYSTGGVIWHMIQYSVPFLFFFLVQAFRAADPTFEEASRMSGAGRWRTLFKITLVLILPAILSSALMSFIRGIENLESPLFFGVPAGINVVSTAMYDAVYQSATPNYQIGAAMAVAMLVSILLVLTIQSAILLRRNVIVVTGKGYAPRLYALGAFRWLSFAVCGLAFLVMSVLPLSQLLIGSFQPFIGDFKIDALTLDHYRYVLSSDPFRTALTNSLVLGFLGACAAMVIGVAVAYLVTRTQVYGRRLLDVLAWLPWLMPGMMLGLGFLWTIAFLPGPVNLYGTMWALLIAYVAMSTPLSTQMMSNAFRRLSFDLEECSRVSGGTWLDTFLRIVAALTWPALLVAWILVFFAIIRDLSVSVLLYSVDTEVFSVLIWRWWSDGRIEEVCAASALILLLVLALRIVQLASERILSWRGGLVS